MGINIGAAARAVSALPPANRPDRTPVRPDPRVQERTDIVQRPEEPEIRAGFGENTLSPSAAALETLDSNLEAAERIVPTVQELRERSRVTQAARPDTIESRATAPAPDVRRLETVRPEPSAAVRNFVEDTNPVQVRPPAETPPAEDEAVDSVPPRETGTEAPREPVRGRFDIRV